MYQSVFFPMARPSLNPISTQTICECLLVYSTTRVDWKEQWRIQDLRKGVSKFVGGAHMAGCRVSGPSRGVWGMLPQKNFAK